MNKSTRYEIRLSPEKKQKMKEYAAAHNMDMSQLIIKAVELYIESNNK